MAYEALHSLAKKSDMPTSIPESPDPKPYYPSLTLDAEQLPQLQNYEVGEEVTLIFKAKVVGHEIRERDGEKKIDEYRIELLKGSCKHDQEHELMEEMNIDKKTARKAFGKYDAEAMD